MSSHSSRPSGDENTAAGLASPEPRALSNHVTPDDKIPAAAAPAGKTITISLPELNMLLACPRLPRCVPGDVLGFLRLVRDAPAEKGFRTPAFMDETECGTYLIRDWRTGALRGQTLLDRCLRWLSVEELEEFWERFESVEVEG